MHSNNSKDENLIEEAHTLIDALYRPSEESNSSMTTSPLEARTFTNVSKSNHPLMPDSEHLTDKSKHSTEKLNPQNYSKLFQDNYALNTFTPDKMELMTQWNQAHLNQNKANGKFLFPSIQASTIEDSSPYPDRQYKSMECGGETSLTPSPVSVGTKSICSPNTLSKKSPDNAQVSKKPADAYDNISQNEYSLQQLEIEYNQMKLIAKTNANQRDAFKEQFEKSNAENCSLKEAMIEYDRRTKDLEEEKQSLEKQIMGKPPENEKKTENLRNELGVLRKLVKEKERKINQLDAQLKERDTKDNIEMKSLMKEFDNLSMEVHKLKLINAQLTKESKNKETSANKNSQILPNIQMQLDEQILKNTKLQKENDGYKVSLEKAINEITVLKEGADVTEKYIKEQRTFNNQEESQQVANLQDEIQQLKAKLEFVTTTKPHNIDSQFEKLKEEHTKQIASLTQETQQLKQKLSQASNVSMTGLYEWVGVHNAQEFDSKKEKIKEDLTAYEIIKVEFQKCQERNQELEENMKDYEQIKQKVTFLDSIKGELEAKLKMLPTENNTTQLESKINSLSGLLAQKEKDIGILEETKQVLEKKEEQLQAQLQELQDSQVANPPEEVLEEWNTFYQKMGALFNIDENENFQSLAQIEESIEEVCAQMPKLKEQLEDVTTKYNELAAQMEEKDKMLISLQTQLIEQEKSIENNKGYLTKKQEDISKLNDQVQQYSELQTKYAEAMNLNTKLTQDLEKLKDSQTLLDESIKAKSEQYNKLLTASQSKDTEISTLQNNVSQLQDDKTTLQKELESQKQVNVQANGEIVTFRSINEQDKNSLNSKIREIQAQLEYKTKILSNTESKLNDLQNALSGKEDYLKVKDENKRLREDITQGKAEENRLSQLLNEAKIEMNKIISASKKLSSRSSTDQFSELIKKEQNKNNQYEETIAKLKSELANPIELQTHILQKITDIIKGDAICKEDSFYSTLHTMLTQWKESVESEYAKEITQIRALVNPTYNQQSPNIRESIEQLKETIQNNDEKMKQKVKEQVEIEKKHIKEIMIGEIHSEIKKRQQKKFQTVVESPQSLKKSTDTMVLQTTSGKVKNRQQSAIKESMNDMEVAALLEKYADCIQTERQVEIKEIQEKCSILTAQLEKQQSMYNQMKSDLEGRVEEMIKELNNTKEEHITKLKEIELQKSDEVEQMQKKISEEYSQKISQELKEKEEEHEELLKIKEEEIKAQLNTEYMANYNKKKEELTRQFNDHKDSLAKDFEQLKQQMQNEMLEKAEQIDKEYNSMQTQKQETNRMLEQKAEEKTKLLENVISQRKKELEEEATAKLVETQRANESSMKSQLDKVKIEYDKQLCNLKTDYDTQLLNLQKTHKEEDDALNKAIATLKAEKDQAVANCEKEIAKTVKKAEKESQNAAAETQRKLKTLEEKKQASISEYQSELSVQIEELKTKHNEEKKKLKEDTKAIIEKHKVNIKALKDQHNNDNIKKDIENQREIKKMQSTIDQLKKDMEIKDNELDARVKEEEEKCSKKLNTMRAKIEKESKAKEQESQVKIDQQSIEKQIEEKYRQQIDEAAKTQGQLEAMQMESESQKRKLKECKTERDKLIQKVSELEKQLNKEVQYYKAKEKLEEKGQIYSPVKDTHKENKCSPKDKKHETAIKPESKYEGAKIFESILECEFEKILILIGYQTKGLNADSINKAIASKLRMLSSDYSSNELLSNCMKRLNAVMIQFKENIEKKHKKEKEKEKDKEKDKEREREETKKEPESTEQCTYIHQMDEQYSTDIINKISPIRNTNGKYVVDIEKVFKDLLLVRDSLSKIFKSEYANAKPSTQYEELFTTDSKTTLVTINDCAQRYRALLNSILRFTVEATWLLNDINKKKDDEEGMRLKLKIADQNGRIKELEKHILCEKGTVMFIDLKEMELVKEGTSKCKDMEKTKAIQGLITDINGKTGLLQNMIESA